MISDVNSGIRNEFKKRPVATPGYRLALAFDTNFKVPLVGTDKYFGRIYFTPNAKEVKFRDELIAERRMKEEQEKVGRFYYTGFDVKDINSPQGLTLVKAAGAEVTLKSIGNFSTTQGGRLTLRVKIPMQKPSLYVFDIEVKNGVVKKYLINGTERISFDTFKINAETNMFGTPTILSGIDNVQFLTAGKVTHIISQ